MGVESEVKRYAQVECGANVETPARLSSFLTSMSAANLLPFSLPILLPKLNSTTD